MKKTDIARIIAARRFYPMKRIADALGVSRSNQYRMCTTRKRYKKKPDDELYLSLIRTIIDVWVQESDGTAQQGTPYKP